MESSGLSAESAEGQRPSVRLGLSRLEAGLAFFGMFYVFILVGWYPELQMTYVQAYRGTDLVGVALLALAAGAAWGSGGVVDMLLVATAAALGCAAGFGLGAALVAELAEVRPFYASTLDPVALESALWAEFIPVVVGSAVAALVGAVGATLAKSTRATLGARATALGLLGVAIGVVGTAALGVASIGLLVGRISPGASAPPIDPFAIRAAIIVFGCLAAGSVVVVLRRTDGRTTVETTVPRVLAGLALVVLPFLVANVYRSLVLDPF